MMRSMCFTVTTVAASRCASATARSNASVCDLEREPQGVPTKVLSPTHAAAVASQRTIEKQMDEFMHGTARG